MRSILFALFFLTAASGVVYAEDSSSGGPNPRAMAEFDDEANGGTVLSEAVGPVDRDAIEEQHEIDREMAEEDELWAIDDALMYEHARKKGWINDD